MCKKTIVMLLLCIGLLGSVGLRAQDLETKLPTTVTDVLVYKDAAQLKCVGKTKLTKGKNSLLFTGLSDFIDARSIQVRSNVAVTIQSMNYEVVLNQSPELLAKRKEIVDKQKLKMKEIEYLKSKLQILTDEYEMIMANKQIGGSNVGVPLANLRAVADFYRERLTAILDLQLGLQRQIADIQVEIAKISEGLAKIELELQKHLGQIRLVLDADKEGMATFDLSFLVTNAGWTPEYDLRLVDVNSPLSLTFKARVWQKTGVDWTGVKLSLTNAQPSLSQLKPELNPWYLSQYAPTRPKVNLSSYAQTAVQNGMVSGVVVDETSAPLPGVTVMVTGTTHGTVTDFDGRFSIELPQGSKQLTVQFIGCVSQTVTVNGTYVNVMLQPDVANLEEVVVVGYGVQKKSLFSRRDKKVREEVTDSVSSVTAEQEEDMQQRFVPNQMVENLTNVRYDIETPYSVASDGKSFTVDITKVEVKANYMYVAVPKLDTDAFLTATVPQWSDYQLLDGQANIYFEGTYMGQSMIESNFITDTLQLGIGRDKSIVVKRDKLKDLSSKSFFGSKRTVERGFEISVRNTKKIPIEIVIEDQYPVTSNEAVKVEHIDHSGAELVGSTGKLKWVLKLQPGEVVKRNLKYSVEFPTKLNLYVE